MKSGGFPLFFHGEGQPAPTSHRSQNLRRSGLAMLRVRLQDWHQLLQKGGMGATMVTESMVVESWRIMGIDIWLVVSTYHPGWLILMVIIWLMMVNNIWLVVYPPHWHIWVRQLGWWHSQLNGKIKFMFQTTNQYMISVRGPLKKHHFTTNWGDALGLLPPHGTNNI